MIGGRRPLQGRKPGDRRVRVERPHAPTSATPARKLVAREAASIPRPPTGRAVARVRGVFFGRPLANEEEIEERLSKKKALAIFSSDAICSSAYATEEILRVLIVARRRRVPRSRSRSRSPSRSCWPSCPPATARSAAPIPTAAAPTSWRGPTSRRCSGSSRPAPLLIDYVMTVAVSTSSAIKQILSVIPEPPTTTVLIAFVVDRAHHHRQPAGPARVRQHLRGPDLPVRRARPADRRPSARSGSCPGTRRRSRPSPTRCRRDGAAGAPAAQGVRERLGRIDGRRGDRQRRAGIQATGSPERGQHDDRDVHPARDPVRRAHGLRRPFRAAADRGGRSVGVALAAATAFGDGSVLFYVRRQHRAHPVPRREHVLQRLPATGRDPGRGRLHASPVLVPRRPPRVLVGHRAAGGDRVPAPLGVRWRHPRPDPAVLGGGLPVLHAQPVRDGQALAAAYGSRAGAGGSRSTPWAG